ncbi:MAG: hypothetical protein LBV08_11580 [Clostridiales bacterium]|jgi:hypothetical protein|nr:hypothetical protein [Clostridiales bacterium]
MQKRNYKKQEGKTYKDSMFNQAIASAIVIAAVILLNLIDTKGGMQIKDRVRAAINKNMSLDDFKKSTVYVTDYVTEKIMSFKNPGTDGAEQRLAPDTPQGGAGQPDRVDQSVLENLLQQEDSDKKKQLVPE